MRLKDWQIERNESCKERYELSIERIHSIVNEPVVEN